METYDMKDFDGAVVSALEVHESKEGAIQMFNISNDYDGRTFVAMLKKALNKSSYSIRVRGSQKDRISYKKGGITLSPESVPLKYADRLRVYITNDKVIEAFRHDLQEEAAQLAEALTEVRRLKQERGIIVGNYNDLNKFYKERGDKIQDLENEIRNMKEEANKLLYFGATPEQIEVCKRYEDTTAVRMAKAIFQGGNKLQVVAAFKNGTGQTLRDAKTVCDYLVFR